MEELDEHTSDGNPRSPPGLSKVLFDALDAIGPRPHRSNRRRFYRRTHRHRAVLRRPNYEEIIDDRKCHLLILVEDRLERCLVCNRGSQGTTVPVFQCKICWFSLHIGCALPPVATTKHHRHPLSYADSYVEDDSGEYYCDNCETQRNPKFPVYRCLEGNCRFVAHFNCVFSEDKLSIAHKFDNKRSTLLIINPYLTAIESLKSIAEDEAAKLNAIVRAARTGKLVIMEEPQLDDSGCSTQKGPIYDDFIVFLNKYISIPRDTISERMSIETHAQVANVDKDTISKFFAPVLKAWFSEHVNPRVEYRLSPRREQHFFVALCKAIYNMYHTKDPNITEDLLFAWWDCYRTADLAEFEVQLAFDLFIKALHIYFDFKGSLNTDCSVSVLDNIKKLSLEEKVLEEKYTLHVAIAVANSRGEYLSQTLELVEEVEYTTDNSWMEYDNQNLIENGIPKDDENDGDDEDDVDDDYVNEKWVTAKRVELRKHTNESSLSEEPLRGIINIEGKEKIEFIRHCRIVKNKIEAFAARHFSIRSLSSCAHKHRMTIYDEKNSGRVHCFGCKLSILETPIYGCTFCKFFLHKRCAELPRRIRCILHDHDLNLRQFGSSLHLNGEDVSNEICCFVCNLPIWGPTYHCTMCELFLHKLCVQLPLEIQHSLHPRHPLYLDLAHDEDRTCNACGEQWRGCAYACQKCKFYLEVRCIYLRPIIKIPSHQHLLTLVEERFVSPQRACYACGRNLHEHGPFLYCMQWKINFHVQCCFPSTNACTTHRHLLTLSNSYVDDDSPDQYCDNCEEERHANHAVYVCQDCDYVAHISCENWKIC